MLIDCFIAKTLPAAVRASEFEELGVLLTLFLCTLAEVAVPFCPFLLHSTSLHFFGNDRPSLNFLDAQASKMNFLEVAHDLSEA